MFEVHSINTSLNRYTCSTYFNLFLVFTGKYLTPIQVYKNSSSSTTGKSPKHSDVVLDLTILTRNVEHFHFPIHSTEVSMLSHFLKKDTIKPLIVKFIHWFNHTWNHESQREGCEGRERAGGVSIKDLYVCVTMCMYVFNASAPRKLQSNKIWYFECIINWKFEC